MKVQACRIQCEAENMSLQHDTARVAESAVKDMIIVVIYSIDILKGIEDGS